MIVGTREFHLFFAPFLRQNPDPPFLRGLELFLWLSFKFEGRQFLGRGGSLAALSPAHDPPKLEKHCKTFPPFF